MPPVVKKVVHSRSFGIYAFTLLSAIAYGIVFLPVLTGS